MSDSTCEVVISVDVMPDHVSKFQKVAVWHFSQELPPSVRDIETTAPVITKKNYDGGSLTCNVTHSSFDLDWWIMVMQPDGKEDNAYFLSGGVFNAYYEYQVENGGAVCFTYDLNLGEAYISYMKPNGDEIPEQNTHVYTGEELKWIDRVMVILKILKNLM